MKFRLDKKNIRKEIKQLRLSLQEEEKQRLSREVFSKIEELTEFVSSKNILLYYSLPDELPTVNVLEEWCLKKNIYLPRVNGENLELLRYDIAHMSRGAFDIEEPNGNDIVSKDIIDMIIVPAVAFDRSGNRLGRGKGYYDRLLSNNKAIKIGVGYDFQLFDSLPTEPHDIPMDIIITPNTVIKL